MNLLHLQYFHSVAKEGGFTKASQALGIRQPAISKMVGQLEDYFGFKLFERKGQSVLLTSRGREVFKSSQEIFGEVDRLKGHLSEIRGECFGDLKFAASDSVASHLVPQALKPFLKKHPKVYPQFVSGPSNSLLKSIRTGQLEFGLFFHTPDLPQGLAITDRLAIRFHLVVRTDLASDKNVLQRFIGSREIDDTATRDFPTYQKWLKRHRAATIAVSTNNISAHKNLVLNGVGIAVLPSYLIERELKIGRFKDLMPNEDLNFELKMIARETATLSLNAKSFLAVFREKSSLVK